MPAIIPIPAFSDNYIWLLREGRHAAVVDPGDAAPVLAYLEHEGLALAAIVTTHHHGDHVGGNAALLAQADGHVWEWTAAAEQLADIRSKFTLCASLRRPDGIRVRVVHTEVPHADAQSVAPTLEDAYTWLLDRDSRLH